MVSYIRNRYAKPFFVFLNVSYQRLFLRYVGNNENGDDKMYSYFYLWAVWVLWIMIAFYLQKNKFRTISFIFVLLLLISFRYQQLIFMELPFLVLLGYTLCLMWIQRIHWRHYVQAILLSLLYASYMIWSHISPIFDRMTLLVIGVVFGFLYLQYVRQTLYDKIIIWNIGLIFGHFIYSMVLMNYELLLNRNDLYFWNLYAAVILLLAIHSLWLKGLQSLENLEKNINKKKRCSH